MQQGKDYLSSSGILFIYFNYYYDVWVRIWLIQKFLIIVILMLLHFVPICISSVIH